jgi:hypothetical protein
MPTTCRASSSRSVYRRRAQQGASSPAAVGLRYLLEKQKRKGWEMAVRIEKVIATVLNEAHGRQVEEVMDVLSEGQEGFYG